MAHTSCRRCLELVYAVSNAYEKDVEIITCLFLQDGIYEASWVAEAGGGEQRSMSWHCLVAAADGPVLTDPAETLGPCQKLRRLEKKLRDIEK